MRTESEILSSWSTNEVMLSVACITYNHGDFIAEMIEGCLKQVTNFGIEIIIGEDKSTDQTLSVIQSYAERYPSIVKVMTSAGNVGQQQNALRVKNAAKGKYIAVCEGDDYWVDPQKIQVQVDFLESNTEYALCYTPCAPMYEGEGVVYDQRGTLRDTSALELKRGAALASLTVVYRNIVEFPEEYLNVPFGDTFCWSLCGNVGPGKFLPNVEPSIYRIHEGGAYSMQSYDKRIKMTILSYTLIGAYYDRIGDTEMGKYFRYRSIALNVKNIGFRGVFEILRAKVSRDIFRSK